MESLEEKKGVVSTELPPLILPDGISEDELPKVIINILLRRALSEKNQMSKWVLLGALEVLQGRTPKMTTTMLSHLVNVSQKSEECNFPSRTSMNKQQYNIKKDISIIYKSVGIQVDLLDSKQFVDKSLQINIVPTTSDIDVQCEPLVHSKEVQCQPATRTNWAQTLMKPKLVTNWSQTPINIIEKCISPQIGKADPIQKCNGDADNIEKHKESNGDVENSLKHKRGKLNVLETLKHKKSYGEADNSLKYSKNKGDVEETLNPKKSKLDVAETFKHSKSNGDADNSLKHHKSKLNEPDTLKHNKSNGDTDNSFEHNKSKGVVEETSKQKKSKGDLENSSKNNKSKKKEEEPPWNHTLVKVDGIPKQREKLNRLIITSLEVTIPLNDNAKLHDPRLQKYR